MCSQMGLGLGPGVPWSVLLLWPLIVHCGALFDNAIVISS